MTNSRTPHPRWVIIGAGAFGREVCDWIHRAHGIGDRLTVFLDDARKGRVADRWDVVGTISRQHVPTTADKHVIAIADPKGRERVAAYVKSLKWRVSSAMFGTVAGTVPHHQGHSVAEGLVMCPGSVISSGAEIGAFCHINLNATVGHDVLMGDFCTVACGADIMGNVWLGKGVMVGSGARILPGLKVGAGAVIGAGAVVMQDVPEGATVAGNPARRV